MKTNRWLSYIVAFSCFVASYSVRADLVSTFSGPDDIDLSGDVVYAVDFPGAGGTVKGVNFTGESTPGVTINSNFAPDPWATRPDYGSGSDSDNLESIMHGIRAGLNGGGVAIDIDVDPSKTYQLQLFFSENFWDTPGSRTFDVSVENTEVLTDFDILDATGGWSTAPNRGAVYISDPMVAGDGILSISLTPGSGIAPDTNPIINAFALTSIPEPTGFAILLFASLGLACARRR